jgi:hypothetical protein
MIAAIQCYDERISSRMKIRRAIFATTFVGASLCVAFAQHTGATGRLPYDGSDSMTGPKPIHVDQNCRILPHTELAPHAKKIHPYFDSTICDLESENDSTHWDEKIADNQLHRTFVRVSERTFVLQNIADEPLMFIVEYDVPRGWSVDSDPQPWQSVGRTAFFHVYVNPGETVRLHVGVRREWPARPKPI